MADEDVDLFVIGAGSGGVRAARIAASHGAKVMIAEDFRIGGTCVIRGCVPKKLLVYASRYKDHFADSAGFGWSLPKPSFDWPQLVAAKEKEISRLSGLYRANLEKSGVKITESRASLADAQSVHLEASDQKVRARKILVSTGAVPVFEPDIPGREFAITSNEIFDLPALPESLAIVGGGYIAVEFAAIFARFGTKVTLVVRGENVLRGFDDDLRTGLRDGLAEAGIKLLFGMRPTRIDQTSIGLRMSLTESKPVEAEQVLIATGRHPNTKGLGLEKAGVECDELGAIMVDAYSKTNVDSIYAVGDVTNRVQLTPVAIREGHAFADTVFGGKPVTVSYEHIPTAVFSTPEIGTVGLTEADARAAYDCVDIYMARFRPLKATLSGSPEKTLMKLIVDGQSDRVLGVHILGEDAGEMAQTLAIAVQMGAKKADFDATMALHPTSAEELVTLRTRTARYEREVEGPEGPDSGPLEEVS
ncbi:MAG TPA: glutathione-disulfide reductase [Methylocella sp.]|nr:glutathione-disulfide reductase [Methylocella sp.]